MTPVRLTSILAVFLTATFVATGPALADPTPAPAASVSADPTADPAADQTAGQGAAPTPQTPEPTVAPGETLEPAVQPDDQADGPTTNAAREQSGAGFAAYTLQFTAPAPGAAVPAGDVSWRLQASAAELYSLTLTCTASGTQQAEAWSDYEGEILTGTFLDLPVGDSCDLHAHGNSTGDSAYVAFSTVAPTPEVRNLAVGPTTFYPYVRDGYRDTASIAFTTRLDSDVTVRVTNRAGRTVWTKDLAARSSGDYYERRTVRWPGRSNGGRLQATGRYRIAVTADLAGSTRTARSSVVLARGVRTFTVTREKDGWYDSVDSTKGNCYTSNYYPGNHLDCWGGRYARADYRFRVPANARIKSWSVRGETVCCTTGRLTKTGTRTSARAFRVRVQATGWRGYVVRRVLLTYSYRRAI